MLREPLKCGDRWFMVSTFGADEAPNYAAEQETWSLVPLQHASDADRHPALAGALEAAFREAGIQDAFAPRVSAASAIITRPGEPTECIELGWYSRIRRSERAADGLFLARGASMVASPAGCPLIIANAGPFCVVAHAGRDSLIDPGVLRDEPTRQRLSVVEAIVEALREAGQGDGITMTMLFAIPAEAFVHRIDDPTHGARNRALARFVEAHYPQAVSGSDDAPCIDLEEVFRQQAIGARVSYVRKPIPAPEGFAHTRDGKGAWRRNLVIITRAE